VHKDKVINILLPSVCGSISDMINISNIIRDNTDQFRPPDGSAKRYEQQARHSDVTIN